MENVCEWWFDEIDVIKMAIGQTKSNKNPGLDGLTHDVYKTFSDILAPILWRVYKCMEEKEVVQETMATGVDKILLKNRGNPLKLENYGPLSFIMMIIRY